MTAGDVIKDALLLVGDAGMVHRSKQEILLMLNEAQNIFGEALGRTTSTLLEQQVTLHLVDGVADLPADFVAIRRILGNGFYYDVGSPGSQEIDTYRIVGSSLYLPVDGDVEFFYWRSPSSVESEVDVLDFPDTMRGSLRKVLIPLLNSDEGLAESTATAISNSMLPRERRGRVRRNTPFYV